MPPSQRTELPIPRELDELVLACLEKDPDKRPQNAEELFQMACGCRTCDGWNQTHGARVVGGASAGADRAAHARRPTPSGAAGRASGMTRSLETPTAEPPRMADFPSDMAQETGHD